MIRVKGVAKLHGARHAIIADRIETGTFLIAGAITRGDLHVSWLRAGTSAGVHRETVSAGAEVSEPAPGTLRVRAGPETASSVDVTTEEHPGFATDLQAQFMALMTQRRGDFDHHRNHF